MAGNALVVGAAGGVGLQVARQLVAQGYRVLGTVLDDVEAATVRSEASGVEQILKLDMSDADTIAPVLTAALARHFEPLDAVVVCAAISPFGPLETVPLANLRATLEINTVSDVAIYQACMPLLRASKGRLVLISSFAGKVGLPMLGHYGASKFALEGLGDVMRREAGAWGVEVILIEPGGIRTPMVAGQIATMARDRASMTPEVRTLYGQLYDQLAGALQMGWDHGMDPAIVARQIVEAIATPHPQARYAVGDDAKYMCDVVARMPEPEADAAITNFLSGGNEGQTRSS